MQAAPDPTASIISNVVLFGGIILIFYFLMIRPQQKRMKEHKALLASIKQGDKVITSSGMHGEVASVQENTVKIIVADNMHIVFDKSAISSVVPKGDS
ncbi:MAG: preprotein translocase subunit YajC [Bradyrhizobiaceae bacterium]|nr:preprotein translocase subunit YajC [Bradyrhizobiaceae bacterium]